MQTTVKTRQTWINVGELRPVNVGKELRRADHEIVTDEGYLARQFTMRFRVIPHALQPHVTSHTVYLSIGQTRTLTPACGRLSPNDRRSELDMSLLPTCLRGQGSSYGVPHPITYLTLLEPHDPPSPFSVWHYQPRIMYRGSISVERLASDRYVPKYHVSLVSSWDTITKDRVLTR